MRALLVTPTYTLRDDTGAGPTPVDAFAAGVGTLLDRVAAQLTGGDGVLLVDAGAAGDLGLPTAGPLPRGGVAEHPAIGDAAGAGWRCSGVGDWSTFYRPDGGPAIHVGLTHLIDSGTCPLIGPHPADTVAAFGLWHRLTGSAWHHTSGVAGTAILRQLVDVGRGRPTWKPKQGGPDHAHEDDYRPSQWRARLPRDPGPGHAYAHGYDQNRAYIGAAGVVEVAPWTLRPGGRTFDASRAGWWLIECAPWNEPRLPDPAGYGNRVRPVTTPTLALLEDLTAQGVYGGVRILDSWTGPGRRILRPWAERMRDAYIMRAPDGQTLDVDPLDVDRVAGAVKDAGRETLGMLASSSNWIFRPDWWYAVVAQARVNLWRRMWQASRAGRWPLQIDVDHVWFASDDPDWQRAAPPGFPTDESGRRLGYFKPKGSTRRKDSP